MASGSVKKTKIEIILVIHYVSEKIIKFFCSELEEILIIFVLVNIQSAYHDERGTSD